MTSKNQNGWKKWSNKESGDPDYKVLEKLWGLSEQYHDSYEPDVEKGLSKLQARIKNDQAKVVKLNPTRRWLRIAASLLVIVAAGFVVNNLISGSNIQSISSQDLVTEFSLEDGTIVTLNAESELRFPETFEGDQRKVLLKGEAFFNVAENPDVPFIVETENGLVKVLGTAFNVRSLKSDNLETVHVEHGKVAYSSKNGTNEQILKKGDIGVLAKDNGQIEVQNDKRFNSFSWRTRELAFFGNTLKEIFEQVSQNINVEFEVAQPEALNCEYTVDFSLKNIEQVLKRLEVASGDNLQFEKIGTKSYKVLGSGCDPQ